MYRQVVYRELWPGIDMAFRLSGGRLRYELVVRPGADPGAAQLAWAGGRRVTLTPGGALRVDTAGEPLIDAAPRTFQRVGGRRVAVPSRYRLGGGGRFGFEVGSYDRRRPLVIDPELAWSTYLGGNGSDQAEAVALDAAGNVYVAGGTFSEDFPVTPGAADAQKTEGSSEGFVSKFTPDGSRLLWSTFMGGSHWDAVQALTVDPEGHAYAGGVSGSFDFPVTPGAFDSSGSDRGDGFVVKLSEDGTRFEYATYLGSGDAEVSGIAVDGQGNVVAVGDVCCFRGFPTTPGAFQRNNAGFDDAFAAKLNADGSALVWSTLLGGTGFDWARAVDLGPDGTPYVAGDTNTSNGTFPVHPGVLRHHAQPGEPRRLPHPPQRGRVRARVLRLHRLQQARCPQQRRGRPAGKCLRRWGCAGGRQGLPGHAGRIRHHPSSDEGFVMKIRPGGASIAWGTYLGGLSYRDMVYDVAVDSQGSVYAVGMTNSYDFPVTSNAFQRTLANASVDGFVTKLDPTGSSVVGSTFIGGEDDDLVAAVAIDRRGAAAIAG